MKVLLLLITMSIVWALNSCNYTNGKSTNSPLPSNWPFPTTTIPPNVVKIEPTPFLSNWRPGSVESLRRRTPESYTFLSYDGDWKSIVDYLELHLAPYGYCLLKEWPVPVDQSGKNASLEPFESYGMAIFENTTTRENVILRYSKHEETIDMDYNYLDTPFIWEGYCIEYHKSRAFLEVVYSAE